MLAAAEFDAQRALFLQAFAKWIRSEDAPRELIEEEVGATHKALENLIAVLM